MFSYTQTQQNTSLYVVRSLLQQKRDLHVFATEHTLPATLTAHQWELIDKTAGVLSSIEELTRNVNRKTATAPDGIPAITDNCIFVSFFILYHLILILFEINYNLIHPLSHPFIHNSSDVFCPVKAVEKPYTDVETVPLF